LFSDLPDFDQEYKNRLSFYGKLLYFLGTAFLPRQAMNNPKLPMPPLCPSLCLMVPQSIYTTIHEIEYDLRITSIETFDEDNKPLKLQEFSNETSLMFEKEYFYENKHLVKITFKDLLAHL
jgi:hypothetical protein